MANGGVEGSEHLTPLRSSRLIAQHLHHRRVGFRQLQSRQFAGGYPAKVFRDQSAYAMNIPEHRATLYLVGPERRSGGPAGTSIQAAP